MYADPAKFHKPRKSLGQNFLIDRNILNQIVGNLNLTSDDHVLEIGPGTGFLTELIQPLVQNLIAVEIDNNLVPHLMTRFAGACNFRLVHQDFLKVDLRKLAGEGCLRIVGNIPYHITSPILFKVFANRQAVDDLTLLIQREVAKRVVAAPHCKEYGILSVFSQAYAEVKILMHVPRTVFRPRPKVDSSLVRWSLNEIRSARLKNESVFRDIVRKAFGQRRKMLRKSLRAQYSIDAVSGFDFRRRPEQLTVDEWIDLANSIAV